MILFAGRVTAVATRRPGEPLRDQMRLVAPQEVDGAHTRPDAWSSLTAAYAVGRELGASSRKPHSRCADPDPPGHSISRALRKDPAVDYV